MAPVHDKCCPRHDQDYQVAAADRVRKPLLPLLARLEALAVPEYTQPALLAVGDHGAVADLPVELPDKVLISAHAIRQEDVPLLDIIVPLCVM